MAYALFALMCAIYGTTFLAIKVGLNHGLAPLFSSGVRFFAAALIMLFLLHLTKKLHIPKTGRQWWALVKIGAYTTTLCFAAVYWGEQYVSSGLAALVSAASPLAIAVLYNASQGKRITVGQGLGFGLAMLGVLMVVWPTLDLNASTMVVLALVVLVIGELFYSSGSVQGARLIRESGIDPLSVNAWQSLFGGVILILLSLVFEPASWTVDAFDIGFPALASLAYLTLFGTVVAASIYFWLMQRISPLFAATWLYISPVIAVLAGALVLHEPIGNTTLPGTAVILTGVFFANDGHGFIARRRHAARQRRLAGGW